jgi:hypothetical protein
MIKSGCIEGFIKALFYFGYAHYLVSFSYFYILLAWIPHFKSFTVASVFSVSGEQVIIKQTFESPPIEPLRIRVSFESLNGMWSYLLDKEANTFFSASILLLIYFVSINPLLVTPLFLTLSDPAKSTM